MTYTDTDYEIISEQINSIITVKNYELPTEFIERTRYLPSELTNKPGFFKYSYAPYCTEIVNELSPMSNTREVVVIKGAQLGLTTGVLESAVAFFIGCAPRPQLYVSADAELVAQGMESKIERMIDSCGLRDLIKPQTGNKSKKTGDTKLRKDYKNGWLQAIGAQNPGKMRSQSFPVALLDEVDAFPQTLKNEGDPIALIRNRVLIPYEDKGKILYLSTPLIKQTSKITYLYEQGDMREYFIQCPRCGNMIVLKWHISETESKTGLKAGIIFDCTEYGLPIKTSVKYKCQSCGGLIENHEKNIFLKNGVWTPQQQTKRERMKSYHISGLYSPVGMMSWHGMVEAWVEAWDVVRNRMRDVERLREFYNTKLGIGWEERGESPRYERVSAHRRNYASNTILNNQIRNEAGSEILLLTCAVDVQKDRIFCHIMAWAQNGINYTLDFRDIEGDTSVMTSEPWRKLTDIIENEIWTSDDKKQYRIRCTYIDAGYNTESVYTFCSDYSSGVFPSFGRDWLLDGVTYRQASKATIEKAGCLCFHINTTKLKDRIASSFRHDWNTGELQPSWQPNFPEDMRDDILRQYEAEYKAAKVDKRTNKVLGYTWVNAPGADNHFFDTTCYNNCIIEMIAENVCKNDLQLESLSWNDFWETIKDGRYYTE